MAILLICVFKAHFNITFFAPLNLLNKREERAGEKNPKQADTQTERTREKSQQWAKKEKERKKTEDAHSRCLFYTDPYQTLY